MKTRLMLRPGVRRLFGLDLPREDVIAQELQDELALHLELRTEQLVAQGMSRDAAVAQARLRYGAIDVATNDIHRHARKRESTMKRRFTFDSLNQDLRFAARTLGRQKSWTAIAVLTLALGIGANTAVFSVVNDLLLNPMRYPHTDRLILLSRVNAKSGLSLTPTVKMLTEWKEARSLEALEGVSSDNYTMTTGAEPSVVQGMLISPTFVAFAGARLVAGRSFTQKEAATGAAPVAMLSEHLWRSRFAAATDVAGKIITLNDKPHTIVGVMADGVRTPVYGNEDADVWLPLTPDIPFLSGPVIARLRPGVSATAAQQELQNISAASAKAEATMGGSSFDVSARIPGSTGQTRQSILMLAGAMCLLLLIACANVAHLLMARGAQREREMAVRAALGAGRARIIRQLLTESLLLSGAGCIAGLGLGVLALRAIVTRAPTRLSELSHAHVDGRVVAVSVLVSIVTGIGFGLVSGMQGQGKRGLTVLRNSLGGTADRHRNRLRAALVITENALSVVLLVGATMLIRSVVNLYQTDPGFDPANVYAMPVTLPASRYPQPVNRQLYASQLLEAARRMGGVQEATIAASVPTRPGVMIAEWIAEGVAPSAEKSDGFIAMNNVMPDYFEVMRMKLLSGHTFDATSREGHEMIVSKSFAQHLWHTPDVVGRRLRTAGQSSRTPAEPVAWNTVVGVVADASLLSLRDDEKNAGIYFPPSVETPKFFHLVVRMKPGQSPYASLRRLSLSVDGTMPPPDVLRLSELLADTVSMQRFIMVLLTIFAGLAVMLSAIGLYGVITYMVSQSTREIGVRVALGAGRRDVVRLVMRQGVALSAIGLTFGLIGAIWGTRLLQSSLYGVKPTDPSSYVAGAFVLLSLAVAACIAPTRRAMRIDPMVAMRSD